MYTNGYTQKPFQSLVEVTNAPRGYRVYTEAEFIAASENITLEGDRFTHAYAGQRDTFDDVFNPL